MNATKNQHVIDGIIAGDSRILKAFYKKNLAPARRLILRYQGTTEDVEDIFQEALVLLYHKLRSGNLELSESSVHAYFIGVCKNLWRNQLRKRQLLTAQELQIDKVIDPSISVMDAMTQKHQQQIYYKHFTRLSNTSQQLLALFFEGKSMRDIATDQGYTEGYTRKKKCVIKDRLFCMVQSDPVYAELVC